MKTKLEVCFKDTNGIYKRIVCDEIDRQCLPGDTTLAECMERGTLVCKTSIGTSWKYLVEMEPKQLSWIRPVEVTQKRGKIKRAT